MARNKNREQGRRDQAGRTEKPRKSATESAAQPQGSPADVARKHRQRRFGHN